MKAAELCKLAKSDKHLELYWEKLLEHMEYQAIHTGRTDYEYIECCWYYPGDFHHYLLASEEQIAYIKSLGYKFEIGLHPTLTKIAFKNYKMFGFIPRVTKYKVPRETFKISACCGEE